MTAQVASPPPIQIFTQVVEDLRWQAMSLSLAARRYAMAEAATDRQAMSMVESLRHSREMLRLATRLTEVMTWVLQQRAALHGRTTEAAPQPWLPDDWLLAETEAGGDAAMPAPLAELLNRSLQLYQRVVRLDRQVQSATIH